MADTLQERLRAWSIECGPKQLAPSWNLLMAEVKEAADALGAAEAEIAWLKARNDRATSLLASHMESIRNLADENRRLTAGRDAAQIRAVVAEDRLDLASDETSRLMRERDAAWNEAIEAAAMLTDGYWPTAIRQLKRKDAP